MDATYKIELRLLDLTYQGTIVMKSKPDDKNLIEVFGMVYPKEEKFYSEFAFWGSSHVSYPVGKLVLTLLVPGLIGDVAYLYFPIHGINFEELSCHPRLTLSSNNRPETHLIFLETASIPSNLKDSAKKYFSNYIANLQTSLDFVENF